MVLLAAPPRGAPATERADAIRRYHAHPHASPALIARLPELRGRTLACWCRRSGEPRTPGTLCHGDVLGLCLDTFEDGTLRWLACRPMSGAWRDELAGGIDALLATVAALSVP